MALMTRLQYSQYQASQMQMLEKAYEEIKIDIPSATAKISQLSECVDIIEKALKAALEAQENLTEEAIRPKDEEYNVYFFSIVENLKALKLEIGDYCQSITDSVNKTQKQNEYNYEQQKKKINTSYDSYMAAASGGRIKEVHEFYDNRSTLA